MSRLCVMRRPLRYGHCYLQPKALHFQVLSV